MELIHTIYRPAGSGPFPTILTLHGRGANALDLLGLAPLICGGKFLMICPQGPLETPIGPDAVGYAWYPMSLGGLPNVDAILTSQKKLWDFLDECMKRYPVDPKKLGLLGFSQGGVMAYSLALAHPDRFTALAALSTWLPKKMVEKVEVRDAVETLPTLVQHGTQDPMIDIGRARDSVERLRALHVPLTYHEYDMGHEIRPKGLADLSAWLAEKILR